MNHAFLFMFVVFGLNYFFLRNRVQNLITQNPDKKEGYHRLIRNFIIYGSIPWLIGELGILLGFVNSTFDYLTYNLTNPFIAAFVIYIVFIWVYGAYWIFLQKGAEKLVYDYPGLFNNVEEGNEKFEIMKLKILWVLAVSGGVFSMLWNPI